MAEPQDTQRNRKPDTFKENPLSSPFARQALPACVVDELSTITISPGGACRLHVYACPVHHHGPHLGTHDRLILKRRSLTSFAGAPPKLPERVNQPLAVARNEPTRASKDG